MPTGRDIEPVLLNVVRKLKDFEAYDFNNEEIGSIVNLNRHKVGEILAGLHALPAVKRGRKPATTVEIVKQKMGTERKRGRQEERQTTYLDIAASAQIARSTTAVYLKRAKIKWTSLTEKPPLSTYDKTRRKNWCTIREDRTPAQWVNQPNNNRTTTEPQPKTTQPYSFLFALPFCSVNAPFFGTF